MEYIGPPGWKRYNLGPAAMFIIADGRNVHTLTFTTSPSQDDIETFTAEAMRKAGVHGETVVDEGPATSCGSEPAHRFTVHSLTASGMPMVTHYLVTRVYGGMGTAFYLHAASVGDRQDGIDGLARLCPGNAPAVFPAGWTRPKSALLNSTATSPDGTSTFYAIAIPLNASNVAAYEQRNQVAGTTLADRNEPCLSGTVRRLDVRAGGQIAEIASAYLRGFEYRSVYTRPATADADVSAERALTGFCRPADPNAAAPV